MRFGPGLFTTLLGSIPEVRLQGFYDFEKFTQVRCLVLAVFSFHAMVLLATKQFVESLECFGEVDKCFVFERVSSLLKAAFFMECF